MTIKDDLEKMELHLMDRRLTIGARVEISPQYKYYGNWKNQTFIIGSIYWDRKKRRVTYGIYDEVDTEDGLTDGWTSADLMLV